jgi:PAS domain S-box-containing protein
MRNFRDIPIRQKLLVITMLTTTAALLLSGVGVVLSDSFLLRSYLQRDLTSLARIIADSSTAALTFEDPHAAAEILSTLRARPHLEAACILRANGTALATYFRPGVANICPTPTPKDDIRFTSIDLTVSHPIVLYNRRIGSLVLLYDLDEVYERMLLYGGTVFVVLIASSLIAFLLSSRLRDVIATPVAQLVQATSAVSETRDYTIRAHKFYGDELGRLVDAFNEMLASIETRDSELRQALVARGKALGEAQNARDSLKTTLESIADAVISTDVEGRVVFANRVAQALVKSQETDLTGKPLDDVFHIVNEFTREKVESLVSRVLRDGRIIDAVNHTVLIANDGTETPIDESGAPIRGNGGPAQGAVLVFRDVTVRRHAEETSRLLASIVESSSDAIVGEDLNGIITTWNKGAERIFGYTAEEVIGCPITTLSPPGREQEISSILEQIARGETIAHFQTLRRTKSGDLIHVSLSISPLYDALGRITGASKIAHDITEEVKAAQRLEKLNADLTRSNESLARSNEDLERFAFVASHDLQEPLRMITAYSQLLVERYNQPLDDETAMFVENILGGTTRMRELLADLLAYAEIGAGPQKPATLVDLNTILVSVRNNLQVAIDESKAQILADRLPSLYVYEGHFVSIFQNLIENALKYRSDRRPEIRITFAENAGQMRFAVIDNGIGIAPEYHEKVFSAFKRLHGKKIPGTGIGLAICQRIIERYGGRIWLESEVGKGTAFIFTLPGHRSLGVKN